mgnify:CR=1 FL=1
MKYVLEHIQPYTILLHEEQKKYFRNFNTHAELTVCDSTILLSTFTKCSFGASHNSQQYVVGKCSNNVPGKILFSGSPVFSLYTVRQLGH